MEPQIGMGATLGVGSDRYPYTIVEVSKSKKRIGVRRDNYTRLDGRGPYTENQEYEYHQTQGAAEEYYTLRENGRWVREGESMRGGSSMGIGQRRYYQDPHF